MKKQGSAASTVDEYINEFSKEVQTILERIRDTIQKAAPNAIERISYQMPTYSLRVRP